MNGIPSLYQMTPTGVPFRTGTRGESTSEQRYFVPGFSSVPLTPEQLADQEMARLRSIGPQRGSDGGGGVEAAPSPFSQMTPAEQAAYYAENPTMAGITQLGQQAFGLTSAGMLQNMMDPIGVAQAQTIAQGINPTLATPLGPTNTQQVTPIAPTPTAQLTQMNQQKSEEEETLGVPNIAATVAEALSFADTQDQEAGQNVGAPPGTTADQGGGGGGGGEAPSPDPGTAPSIGGSMDAAGTNNSGTEGVGTDGASPSNKQGGLIKYYNQGGVASLANRVQEKGRGQDTMLVHMTPKEVGGLQALAMAHGGSLTINPQTGLPEAGFLSSILPMVAGAALTIGSGGVINPYMSAAIVGGVMGATSGSLSKGLMAGLGAFGGAGLGTALSAAGAGAAGATTAGQAITPQLAQAASITPQAAATAVPGSLQSALPGLGVSTAGSAAAPAAMSAAPAAPSFSSLGQGVQNLFTKPGTFDQVIGTAATKTAPATGLGGGLGALKTVGMAAAPVLGGMGEEPSNLPIQDQFIRPFKYKARPSAEEDENFRYRTGERGESTAEQRYFGSEFTPVGVYKAGTEPAYGTYAMGGDIEEGVKNGNIRSFDDEYGQDEYAGGGLTAFKAGGLQDGGFVVPADVVAHLGNGSTDAGLRLLAKTLKAKPIKGNGDGMSDSIPTTIGGKQPARVADGEAYISPEVTKKVGSERLYAMMDRIRKAKTGKKKQAPEINTRNYVPA